MKNIKKGDRVKYNNSTMIVAKAYIHHTDGYLVDLYYGNWRFFEQVLGVQATECEKIFWWEFWK